MACPLFGVIILTNDVFLKLEPWEQIPHLYYNTKIHTWNSEL